VVACHASPHSLLAHHGLQEILSSECAVEDLLLNSLKIARFRIIYVYMYIYTHIYSCLHLLLVIEVLGLKLAALSLLRLVRGLGRLSSLLPHTQNVSLVSSLSSEFRPTGRLSSLLPGVGFMQSETARLDEI
jgi:hypothetical protein